MRFLDWLNFYPNTNLRDFLRSIFKDNDDMHKSYFPYEALENFDSLKKPLPNFEDFIDRMSGGENSLDLEYQNYKLLREDGFSEKEALKQLKLNSVPPTGRDLYNQLMEEWTAAGYQTLEDIVVGYIVKDTRPLLHG